MEFDLKSGNWSDNLLTNGDFEKWANTISPNIWNTTISGTSVISRNKSNVKNGIYSLKAYTGPADVAKIVYNYNFTTGKKYKLIVWLWISLNLPVRISSYEGANIGSFTEQVYPDAPGAWFRYEKEFTAIDNDDKIVVENNSSSYTWYVDWIQLYEYEPIVIEMNG